MTPCTGKPCIRLGLPDQLQRVQLCQIQQEVLGHRGVHPEVLGRRPLQPEVLRCSNPGCVQPSQQTHETMHIEESGGERSRLLYQAQFTA